MFRHRLFAAFLALLVVVVHLHCICGHDLAAIFRSDQQHRAPQHCENESACLCRGATLAHSVTWDAPPPSLDPIILDTAGELAKNWLPAEASEQFGPISRPLSPSGRILRAHLSSFLL